MEWNADAEKALKKAPFFVRKRVRERVEKEALAEGKSLITLKEVKTTQARYLTNMDSEIKGYQLDGCFGPNGCPNRACETDGLMGKIEGLMDKEELLSLLKERVDGDLKFHHEFRITLADCPNACSQPQIKDVGIIGASIPGVTQEPCSNCGACFVACPERAVTMDARDEFPEIDLDRCIQCGKCIKVCPTGTLVEAERGFRVQLGGKLGRHPKLAEELPGIFKEDGVLEIVKYCLDFYREKSRKGERFAEIFKKPDMEKLVKIKGEKEK